MTEVRKTENERLSIAVEDFGGQLSSIFDKKNNRELLWCADSSIWNRHAPILFPFVGELSNKQIKYENVVYPMTAHGFARDSKFEFVGIDNGKIIHRLINDDEKRKVYPFEFELQIMHSIEDNCVKVEWQVKNIDNKDIYFQIGGHPAFNVPMPERKDYYLDFGKDKEKLEYICISKDGGTAVVDDVRTLELNEGLYKIGEHIFDDGALIFEDNQFDEVGINFPDKTPYVKVKCEGFPYVGVWTKPTAPFVCLEPWYGRCDDDGFEGELKDKVGIIKLEAATDFRTKYYIEVF